MDRSLAERVVISFFGIRGLGALFYLSHALGESGFGGEDELWSVTAFIILVSVFLHGHGGAADAAA